VLLGSDSHVMAWNPALSIYRVNRHQTQFTLEDKMKKMKYEESKLDFLEELLMRNLDHIAEDIVSYLDFTDQLHCLLVSHLWNEFIGGPVFRKKLEGLLVEEDGLEELAQQEGWSRDQMEGEETINKKLLAKVFLLKDIWRVREPKAKRLFCDSFVLSVKADEETILCGLNNGCVQAWDIGKLIRTREQECHDKGVKCIDMNNEVFLTGSYDTMFKVWGRVSWECLKVFPLHTDSVWDLKMHGMTVATAGLDGTVIVYDFKNDTDLEVRSYIQANGDLVSAVDFSEQFLITGHEDSYIGVWRLPGGIQIHKMTGHTGGVTGVALNGVFVASSSYDTQVRLWNVETGNCLKTFTEPDSFVRCVAFHGQRIVTGDFGGFVHLWDFEIGANGEVKILNHREWECHKGHVVCIQLTASRIVSGSRDRHVIVNDFWAKTQDTMTRREQTSRCGTQDRVQSRFLRPRY